MGTHHQDLPLILNDTIQIPLYQLSKNFRSSQKLQEQNANVCLKALKDLQQRVSAKESTGEQVNNEKIIAALDKIAGKLIEIREQAITSSNEMQNTLESLTFRCAMRNLNHFSQENDSKRARPSKESNSDERMIELALIGNHLLRKNHFETFKTLCREAECPYLAQDVEVFESHHEIYKALADRHEADSALVWCSENRSILKKKNSTFEFDLRLRQFCDIVERGDAKEAVTYSRKYLAQNSNDDRMRKAMATLAFPKGSLKETPYRNLVSTDCWKSLADSFLRERSETLNLFRVSPLEMIIRVGLAATRTQSCKPDGPGKLAGCPSCQPNLGKIALNTPRVMRERSTLVCRISGEPMDELLVLPNGQAYSKAALEAMANSRGDHKVRCPVTHQEFSLKDLRKAYVL